MGSDGFDIILDDDADMGELDGVSDFCRKSQGIVVAACEASIDLEEVE